MASPSGNTSISHTILDSCRSTSDRPTTANDAGPASELVHLNEYDIANINLAVCLDNNDHNSLGKTVFEDTNREVPVVLERRLPASLRCLPLGDQCLYEQEECSRSPRSSRHNVQFQSIPFPPTDSQLTKNQPQSSPPQPSLPRPGGGDSTDGRESSTMSPPVADMYPLQGDKVVDFHLPTPDKYSCTPSGVSIPNSTPYGCGFKVHILSSRKTQCCFHEETNTVFVNKNVDFAAQFSLPSEHVNPSSYCVRALVCLKKPEDIQKLGPVVVRSVATACNASDHPDHFLVSRNSSASYSELNGHKVVTVPLTAIPESLEGGHSTCVYSCNDYSTKFVGKGVNKPTMIIIFSLLLNGMEIARDTVNLRCMSSLTRDIPKKLKREAEEAACSRPTKQPRRGKSKSESSSLSCSSPKVVSPSCSSPKVVSPSYSSPMVVSPSCSSSKATFPVMMAKIPKMLDLVGNDKPDDDGCYTFTCKTKDRSFYNLLKFFKLTYSPMIRAQDADH